MATQLQIRDGLAAYLTREVGIDDFEEWFAANTWDIHEAEEEAAQRLSYAIELRLAEHSSGHLSEEQLREELRPFVESYFVTVLVGENHQSAWRGMATRSRTFRPAEAFAIG